MKPGLVYALTIVILALTVVILLQQRKLGELRNDNAAMHGDTRALITTRNTEAAAATEAQRELRALRAENETLRKDIERSQTNAEPSGAPR